MCLKNRQVEILNPIERTGASAVPDYDKRSRGRELSDLLTLTRNYRCKNRHIMRVFINSSGQDVNELSCFAKTHGLAGFILRGIDQ